MRPLPYEISMAGPPHLPTLRPSHKNDESICPAGLGSLPYTQSQRFAANQCTTHARVPCAPSKHRQRTGQPFGCFKGSPVTLALCQRCHQWNRYYLPDTFQPHRQAAQVADCLLAIGLQAKNLLVRTGPSVFQFNVRTFLQHHFWVMMLRAIVTFLSFIK